MDPDEAVRRVKVALAEMGYSDAFVIVGEDDRGDGLPLVGMSFHVPDAIAWQAFAVVQGPAPCWSCWYINSGSDDVSAACLMGDCANLGPKRPPRELLVSAGPS